MIKGSRYSDILERLVVLLPGSTIENLRERDWRSVTFEGQRLTFAINVARNLTTDRVGQFLKVIGELELPVRQFFVADISATLASNGRIEIEILLIKE
jgi:hypothetical protein